MMIWFTFVTKVVTESWFLRRKTYWPGAPIQYGTNYLFLVINVVRITKPACMSACASTQDVSDLVS